MSIQKSVKYQVLQTSKNLITRNSEDTEVFVSLDLKVSEKSGNYLIHKDISRHKILSKQGTVSTKTRSEVRGGGRKPWKQKGTGRARAGSNRSPLWKGGGVIFGPKPKSPNFKLNQKERKLALQTLFYNNRNNVIVLDNLENSFTNIKSKELLNLLNNLNVSEDQKTLLIVDKKTEPLLLSSRNLKNVELILASNLNTNSLLKSKQIVLTVPALNTIKEIYGC